MSILHKYLLKQNLQFLLICLLACIGIYLLVDVFDRLDKFLSKDAAFQTIIFYFSAKIPLIISQILPAVFLVALLIQLSLMQRERETTALEAGGISFSRLVLFFLVYSILWCGVQFGFSQIIGVKANRICERVWDTLGEDGQRERVFKDYWFRDGNFIVYMKKLKFPSGKGKELICYQLSADFQGITSVVYADKFFANPGKWDLNDVTVYKPEIFSISRVNNKELGIQRNFKDFLTMESDDSPKQMSLWQLGRTISKLEQAGSNVEGLETAWHMKIAYAFTIFLVTMIGLTFARIWPNIFINLSAGMLMTFVYHSIYAMTGTLGEKGVLWPWLDAWLANILIGVPFLFLLLRTAVQRTAKI